MFIRKSDIDAPRRLDEVENLVYAHLKPMGFRKFGRTLHRFVSGDISQVIHFQYHWNDFCVNIGIRVPECVDHAFQPAVPREKYYREYQCNIRSRLGTVSGRRETWFDLRKDPEKLAKKIICQLEKAVLPAFAQLSSREDILCNRRKFPRMDDIFSHLILLEEAMIYGHLGQMTRAKEAFEAYYNEVVAEYRRNCKKPRKIWLRKGTDLGNGAVIQSGGYIALAAENRSRHIGYLDQLAVQLGLREMKSGEA